MGPLCGMPQRPGIRPQRTLDGTRLLVVCVCEAAEVGALKEGGQPFQKPGWGRGDGQWRWEGCGLGAQSHRGDLKAGTPVTHRAQPSGYRLSGSRCVVHEELGD